LLLSATQLRRAPVAAAILPRLSPCRQNLFPFLAATKPHQWLLLSLQRQALGLLSTSSLEPAQLSDHSSGCSAGVSKFGIGGE